MKAAWLLVVLGLSGPPVTADELPLQVARIKHSVVGVGVWDRRATPHGKLAGTGFFVHDGQHVATSFHLEPFADAENGSSPGLSVFIPHAAQMEVRAARRVRTDRRHDLVILEIEGKPGPPLRLAGERSPGEGAAIATTGFPLADTLGLYTLTNAGIVSSVSPVAVPQAHPGSLTAAQIRQLRKPFEILILDMIAYPGHSGSPVYLQGSGEVVGMVAGVYIRQAREGLLKAPSAITYAIPSRHLQALLETL